MGLSVIILSKNDSNLKECLAAVRRHEPDLRVRVVDDDLQMRWPGAIEGIKPFVFARNANVGIKAAGRDDVILLNDDAVLETPRGFTAMQSAAALEPAYGIVSATTNVANNWRQRPAGPGLRDGGPAVAFVCVLIPRRTIERIGLLDERFYGEIDGELVYGGEDTDYCYRARFVGLDIGVFNECYVDHKRLPSTFRPDGRGLPINATRKRFKEIHGIEMETA